MTKTALDNPTRIHSEQPAADGRLFYITESETPTPWVTFEDAQGELARAYLEATSDLLTLDHKSEDHSPVNAWHRVGLLALKNDGEVEPVSPDSSMPVTVYFNPVQSAWQVTASHNNRRSAILAQERGGSMVGIWHSYDEQGRNTKGDALLMQEVTDFQALLWDLLSSDALQNQLAAIRSYRDQVLGRIDEVTASVNNSSTNSANNAIDHKWRTELPGRCLSDAELEAVAKSLRDPIGYQELLSLSKVRPRLGRLVMMHARPADDPEQLNEY